MEQETNERSSASGKKVLIGAVLVLAAVVAVVALYMLDTTGRKGSGLGKEYSYDIEDMGKIDPNMILYQQQGEPLQTGFSAARAVFIGPDGSIYVAGDDAVRVYEGDGAVKTEIPVGGEARCLAVSDDGTMYVGLRDHVQVYDKAGKQLASWAALGSNAVLTSVAVYKDNVFVADAGDRVVLRYDKTGKLLNKIGRPDPDRNIKGFQVPSPYFDLAVASDGLLRVVDPGDHKIEAFTFDGDLEFSWGKFAPTLAGFVGCCNPVNIAILPDGSFVTCEKGIVRVKVYNSDGKLACVVAGPEQLAPGGVCKACTTPDECQSGGFDVAVDSKGRVYVLDTVKNVIKIFSKKKAA